MKWRVRYEVVSGLRHMGPTPRYSARLEALLTDVWDTVGFLQFSQAEWDSFRECLIGESTEFYDELQTQKPKNPAL